jgi:hypothetical protein
MMLAVTGALSVTETLWPAPVSAWAASAPRRRPAPFTEAALLAPTVAVSCGARALISAVPP